MSKNDRLVDVSANISGMCLSELMVSMAMGSVVLASVLSTMNVMQTYADRQHRTVRHQQDLRLGLEVFEQEARLAAADSILSADSDEFQFYANLNGQRTVTTGSLTSGQTMIPVQDGRGWGEGKTITVCGPQSCELHQLARPGQRYQLTVSEPVAMSLPGGASVEVRNKVMYYVKSDDQDMFKLMRMVDGGANTLIGDLKEPRFSYWDESGRMTQQPSSVKRVVLEIESDTPLRTTRREVSLRS